MESRTEKKKDDDELDQYVAAKAEDIYRALSDYSIANAITIEGQTISSRILRYPLNFLLAQQDLPANMRKLELRGIKFGHNENFGANAFIESFDTRCTSFYESAEGREDLHQFFSLLPIETLCHVSAVIFNIQGDINQEKEREIAAVSIEKPPANLSEKEKIQFELKRLERLQAIVSKYNAIEIRIIEKLDIGKLKNALFHAKHNRPFFVEYINTLNRIACMPVTNAEISSKQIDCLLTAKNSELQMLREQYTPEELEQKYKELTLKLEIDSKLLLTEEDQENKRIFTDILKIACHLKEYINSSHLYPEENQKKVKNDKELILLLNELIKFIKVINGPQSKNSYLELLHHARAMTPIIINEFRRLLIDKNLCDDLRKLNARTVGKLDEDADYVAIAQSSLQTLIDILTIIRGQQLINITEADINPDGLTLLDASRMYIECQARMENRLGDMAAAERNCESLTHLLDRCNTANKEITENISLNEQEKIKAILGLCRDLSELPPIDSKDILRFEDRYNAILKRSDLNHELKKLMIVDLLRNYRCFEAIPVHIQGCDLSKLTLLGIYRPNSNFSHTDCSKSIIQDCNLSGVNFSNANLCQAMISNSELSKCNFNSCNMADINLGGAFLCESTMQGCNLINAQLVGAHLEGVNLSESNLWGANLSNAKFNNAILKNADLDHAILIDADFGNVSFESVSLDNAQLISYQNKLSVEEMTAKLTLWEKHHIPAKTVFENIRLNLKKAKPGYTKEEKLALLHALASHNYFKPGASVKLFQPVNNIQAVIQNMIRELSTSPRASLSPKSIRDNPHK